MGEIAANRWSLRKTVRFWEVGRLIFIFVGGLLAWVSYLAISSIQAGLGYPYNGTPSGVALRFAGLCLFLNVCYCLAYVAEFMFIKNKFWSKWGRVATWLIGLMIGAFYSIKIGGWIGIWEFSFR